MSVPVKDMSVMVKDMSVMVPQSTLSFRYILMIFWPTEGHSYLQNPPEECNAAVPRRFESAA